MTTSGLFNSLIFIRMNMITSLFATLAIAATVLGPIQAPVVEKPVFEPVQMTEKATNVGPKVLKPGRIVYVTAYTSEVGQTDSTPCIAADGSDICVKYADGERICATNDHPMHSTLNIDGYGQCTVRDRMNKRYTGTGRVDLYLGMDTPAAKQWGARQVTVTRL